MKNLFSSGSIMLKYVQIQASIVDASFIFGTSSLRHFTFDTSTFISVTTVLKFSAETNIAVRSETNEE